MQIETCFWGLCFYPLDPNSPKFFGFSEYLAGLALMVLAWTTADVRYKFRIQVAPVPLQTITFYAVAIIGLLALLTDLWRANGWLVPQGQLFTLASWQAFLGGVFLTTFLAWSFFAFIRPPKFNWYNGSRFANSLFNFVARGVSAELSIISDEISRSIKPIVKYAAGNGKNLRSAKTAAQDILSIIADKRMCQAIVESSPITAWALYNEIRTSKKYQTPAGVLSRNITVQAISFKESFIYHENNEYDSGFIGLHKPISQTMFGDYQMAECLGLYTRVYSPSWDSEQWRAYTRILLITLRDYIDNHSDEVSHVLIHALDNISDSVNEIYKINGSESFFDAPSFKNLMVVVRFIKEVARLLSKASPGSYFLQKYAAHNFLDEFAKFIYNIICRVSYVRGPSRTCWTIQFNVLWGDMFGFGDFNSAAGKIVRFKVHMLVYREVSRLTQFPNFTGARLLGLCLNVLSMDKNGVGLDKEDKGLQQAILNWTKSNYARLYRENRELAEACLIDGIVYEKEENRLTKEYHGSPLRKEKKLLHLSLDSVVED
ncbi:TPA: hypothetical protein L4V14_005804 [Pseudomonas aeruginosa]|nr:hypothetical protein [Pseudomonas aeruginosa]